MSATIVGVMGPGAASPEELTAADALGRGIAQAGWLLLCGGRGAGVMEAVSRGAKEAGGTTIGILPGDTTDGVSSSIDFPVVTGMGSARNNINVLSSAVVVACGMGAGTASEVALALKAGKPVVLLCATPESATFWQQLAPEQVTVVGDVEEALRRIAELVG